MKPKQKNTDGQAILSGLAFHLYRDIVLPSYFTLTYDASFAIYRSIWQSLPQWRMIACPLTVNQEIFIQVFFLYLNFSSFVPEANVKMHFQVSNFSYRIYSK